MLVLLTGGTGLIGPHVLERLLARGDFVRVLALPDTLEKVQDHDRVEVVVGSLADRDILAQAAEGVDVVYHIGALMSSECQDLVRVNLHGTDNLLEASVASEVKRLVFTSSMAVYSTSPLPSMWPIVEDSPLKAHGGDNLRNYGQSKIDGEKLILHFHRNHKLEYVILRAPAVYGPEAAWVERLLRQLRSNPWQALSPGARAYHMQWVHVDDLAEGIVLAGTRLEAANNIFNIAGDEVFTQLDILMALWKIWRQVGAWQAYRPVQGGTKGYGSLKYDISKAGRLLGFTPKVKLADGVQEIVSTIDQRQPWGEG